MHGVAYDIGNNSYDEYSFNKILGNCLLTLPRVTSAVTQSFGLLDFFGATWA